MTETPSPLRALRARLAALRRRIRGLLALAGLARLVAMAVAVLALWFLSDWLLDLPLAVRRFLRLGLLDGGELLAPAVRLPLLAVSGLLAVLLTRARRGAAPLFAFLAAGLVGVLAWTAARQLAPLAARLSDDDLALAVERRHRGLDDRLAAALDFERELRSPTRGESAAMMGAVVDEAGRAAETLEVSSAVSGRRALAWSGVAAVALAAAVGIVLLMPDTVALWADRALRVEDRPWPRATTVLAVDRHEDGSATLHDPATPYEVAVGRPLTVVAEARGEVPDEVYLVDEAEGGRPLPRRMSRVAGTDRLFSVEVRDVRRPFEFVLRGGDDDDGLPRYRVEITVPPRIVDLRARITPPAYLGRAPEEVEGGNLVVPEGTEVEVSFGVDAEAVEARALLGDQELPAARGEDGRWRIAFPATESVRYRLVVRTARGHENDPARDTYDVRVEPDRPPRIEWTWPRGGVEATPTGRVPLLAVVEDDHGVVSGTLEVRVAGGEPVSRPLVPFTPDGEGDEGLPATDGPWGRRTVLVYVPYEIAALTGAGGSADGAALVPPARLSMRLVATDSKGQAKEGAWAAVDVYRPIEVERSLGSRRSSVRGEIAAVLAEQRTRRQQLADLGERADDDAERDLLQSILYAQAKIEQDGDQAVRSLLLLFNTFVYDRLGAENPTERILAILDAGHRRTYGLPPAEPDATAAPLGDPAFPYAVYAEIVGAWRDRRIFDTGLVQRLLEVVDAGLTVAADRLPAAHAALQAAAQGDRPLAEALAAQDAAILALEDLLAAMRSWQSLDDMILLLRRLVEEQEALDERLGGRPGND